VTKWTLIYEPDNCESDGRSRAREYACTLRRKEREEEIQRDRERREEERRNKKLPIILTPS
jgi:hypothetical protein